MENKTIDELILFDAVGYIEKDYNLQNIEERVERENRHHTIPRYHLFYAKNYKDWVVSEKDALEEKSYAYDLLDEKFVDLEKHVQKILNNEREIIKFDGKNITFFNKLPVNLKDNYKVNEILKNQTLIKSKSFIKIKDLLIIQNILEELFNIEKEKYLKSNHIISNIKE